MIELTDEDILRRLANTEDSTVERKVSNDYRDCLKTAVGFANSLPISDPGIIFVGVFNDGRIQEKTDLDSLQKYVSKEIAKIYPPILPQMKVARKDGREFLVVIVRGSAERPHFAGQAYIRSGSETVVSSEQEFSRLVAERNSKTREILKWLGKEITIRVPRNGGVIVGKTLFTGGGRHPCRVLDCNQFFVTVEFRAEEAEKRAYALPFIEISYDPKANQLELICLDH